MNWLWIGLGLAASVVLAWAFMSLREFTIRKSGDLPVPGKATMSDVQRLIRSDELISAIKCYREIHQVGLAEAKKAVEALANEMKAKGRR